MARRLLSPPPPPSTLIPGEYIQVLLRLISETIVLPGDLIEVGVYKGGSLYRMADYLQSHHARAMRDKRLIGIDTFTGHPYHDPAVDPPHHWKGRFADTSYQAVCKALRAFRFVNVMQGECQEVFARMPDIRFSFAHIDVDIAKASILSTEFIFPRLSAGGAMVFDEFQGYGQEAPLREYFRDKLARLEPRQGRGADEYGMVVRKTAP